MKMMEIKEVKEEEAHIKEVLGGSHRFCYSHTGSFQCQ